jgi:hypothetical protein
MSGMGKGNGELLLNGTVSVWGDANILETDNGDGCITL